MLPAYGGTKAAELRRSAELYLEISARPDHGPYFALSLLLDSGYQRPDLLKIRDLLDPRNGGRVHA